jgi:hypothetical protein
MTDQTPTTAPRGTPPNRKQLTTHLGSRLALWDAVIAMAPEFGAVWRWAHSEATGSWSYRSYLPGERFFIALSLTDSGFETSLNMKPEEWDWVGGAGATEIDFLEGLRAKALASGDNPAWLHIPMESEASLPALAKLLFARARRVQAPRGKKRR